MTSIITFARSTTTGHSEARRSRGWTQLVFAVLLASIALLTGCGGPALTIVKQAAPNPFQGGSFVVAPIDYTGLKIGGEKSESDWLADKDADAKKSWSEDKEAMSSGFAASLSSKAGAAGVAVKVGESEGAFTIKPRVTNVEPGYWALVSHAPSTVWVSVQIVGPDGKVLDEVALEHSTAAQEAFGATRPSIGERVRNDAQGLGEIMAEYLAQRAKGS